MTDSPSPPNSQRDSPRDSKRGSKRGSKLHETGSFDWEIPLQTPPLDGLLPTGEETKEPERKPRRRLWVFLGLVVAGMAALGGILLLPTDHLPDPPSGAVIHLVEEGASWRYLDDGTDPGPGWATPDFDDAAWDEGHGLFGYGQGDETTVLRCRPGWERGEPCPKGGDPDRTLTHFFRHAFEVDDPAAFDRARISLLKDDGAVVYLNGESIIRANMAPGVSGFNEPAAHEAGEKRAWFDYHLDLRKLVPGRNVLAVELHQALPDGADVAFDLKAVAFDVRARAVRRGPYLQMATPTSMVIRWRTVDRIESVVRWGADPQSLDRVARGDGLARDHRVRLEGLEPSTTYAYALGSEEHRLNVSRVFRFTTPPPAGEDAPVRIWAVGDQGTGDSLARKVKLAFVRRAAERPADVWLTLGDNAYDDGTDAEFQRALFNTYGDLIAVHAMWPSTGNHDLKSVKDGRGPYFDIFELPTNGEAGGVASGTESYYSFDHGPVHFVTLDTTQGDLRPGREMLEWLKKDLEANELPWTVAYFHHPPYTDGWHKSDDPKKGWRMTAVRENVLPILEQAGVDLVLAGHSHSYERSYLLHRHYGTSDTLTDAMKLDGGDGRPDGDGAYAKRRGGPGTVYVVAGSSGKLAVGELAHPAMVLSLPRLGSLMIDVDGRRLDLAFVTDTGQVGDHFRLVHR